MIKLDDDLLNELGLGALPPNEKRNLLAHMYETLEKEVGERLAAQMSPEQLQEFEQFVRQEDEAGALQWLEANLPDYKTVVSEEFEKLKIEVQGFVPQILASAQSQQVQSQPNVPDASHVQQQWQQPQVSPTQPQPTATIASAWNQPAAAVPPAPLAPVEPQQYAQPYASSQPQQWPTPPVAPITNAYPPVSDLPAQPFAGLPQQDAQAHVAQPTSFQPQAVPPQPMQYPQPPIPQQAQPTQPTPPMPATDEAADFGDISRAT